MKSASRLIQQKQTVFHVGTHQTACNLQSCRFASGQGTGTVTECKIGQSYARQQCTCFCNFIVPPGKKLCCLLNGECKYLRNTFSTSTVILHTFVVTRSITNRTYAVRVLRIRNLYSSISATVFTAQASCIEAEILFIITGTASCFPGCKHPSDLIHDANISSNHRP